MIEYELYIQHGNVRMYPPIVDGVTVEWERQGQPGKLIFEVIKTESLNFAEGDTCCFFVDGTPLFVGFVFDKSRSGSKSEIIKVTVYDQLFYLRNKDTYVYSNKTAAEVVRMIAEDFDLRVGVLEDTGYKIASRVEDNVSLDDIIQNALDETLKAKTEMYVLYDEAGRLTLTNIRNMQLGVVIDNEVAGDFNYKTSISDKTYNRIKLVYEDDKTGARKLYIAQDGANMNRWGVLQYYEKLDGTANAKTMADALLKLYNQKNRSLKLSSVLGDKRIRGGTSLIVMLDLGDTAISNFLVVERVKHVFKDNQHLMDLELRGGNFVA